MGGSCVPADAGAVDSGGKLLISAVTNSEISCWESLMERQSMFTPTSVYWKLPLPWFAGPPTGIGTRDPARIEAPSRASEAAWVE